MIHKIGIDARLWNETGVGRYIRNLVWELAKIDKKNVYVLFFKENEYLHVALPGENFEKRLANYHWHSFAEQLCMPWILLRERVDIMHFPYFNIPILYPKKFILTSHDLTILHFNTGKASTLPKIFYQLKRIGYMIALFVGMYRASKVIAVSQSTKREIIDHFHISSNKIPVTLEGVDEKIATPSKRFIANDYFLYVGNAYPHKNLEQLINAFSAFKKQDKKNIQLILVGKEDFFYTRLKQKIKEMNLQDAVLFYEKVSDSGLASLYAHALALVAPSLMEGFGLPVLEAMHAKCLVVASDIASFREICEDNALYFDPNSTHALQAILQDIANNKIKQARTLKEGALRQAKKFSWEKMARQTKEIYESCISLR